MSSPRNGQSIPYTVEMSGQIKAVLRDFHAQAVQVGIGKQFVSALRQIIYRLSRDPLGFGEPVYRLPALKLRLRVGAILPLVVDFAVHEDIPLVIIRGFHFMLQP